MHQMSLTGQWEFVPAHEESVTAHGEFATVQTNFSYLCICDWSVGLLVHGEFVTV